MLMSTEWPHGETVIGTDSYGFRALAGGTFTADNYDGVGGYTRWWAATEFSAGCIGDRYISAFYVLNSCGSNDGGKEYLRCTKD
jgi:hypothetical protein